MAWKDSFQGSVDTQPAWKNSFQPASYDDQYAADAKAKNQASGFWDNFGKSVALGAGKRMLGVGEAGLNVAKALGANVDDMKEKIAMGQQEAGIQGTGTGAAGVVGEAFGDPTTYIPVGVGANSVKALMAAGAGAGAIAGATQGTGNKDSSLIDNAENAAIGAGIGGAGGAVIGGGAKLLKSGSQLAGAATNRVAAALGSDPAADRIVYSNMTKKLLADGKTPQEVEQLITSARATGMTPTIGEATGSRGVLQAENQLARGTGRGAQDFNASLVERGTQDIPAQVENMGRNLANGDAGKLYKQAEQEAALREGGVNAAMAEPYGTGKGIPLSDAEGMELAANTVQGMRDKIAARLAVTKSDIEKKTLGRVSKIIEGTDANGAPTYDTLKEIKNALSEPLIENADHATQKISNGHVYGFQKDIESAMQALAPETREAANAAFKKQLAGKGMIDAVNESGVGDVSALYNKLWKTPEQRADFLSKLPDDATRAEYQQFFSTLEKIQNGFGGAEAGISGGAAQGAGIPLSKHGLLSRTVSKVGDILTPDNIGKRAAEAAFNPDVERLVGGMEKAGKSVADSPVIQGATGAIAGQRSRKDNKPAKSAIPDKSGMPLKAPAAPQDVQAEPAAFKPQVNASPANDTISAAATAAGNNPDIMRRIAIVENHNLDPNAHNPVKGQSASGLYQFTDGTWRYMVNKYGAQTGIKVGDKLDAKANATMANLYARDNSEQLKKAIGREPNGTEIYLAHFLGADGAKKLLANLDKPVSAAQIFPSAAQANSRVFFQNGDPRKPLTPAGIYRTLTQRLSEAA